METSLTENEMHEYLNSGWENSPDENEDKIFNQVIDEEIENVTGLIETISTGKWHIDFFTGKPSINLKEYRKELENQIKFLEDWKNKVNKRGSKQS
jgi:hypothetical protein